MIALFSGRSVGEIWWDDRGGEARMHEVRPGDVWFVAPNVTHDCYLERKSEMLMIFLEQWRMKQGLGSRLERVVGTGSVARLGSYFPVQPILRDLHLVVANQSKGLPVCQDGSSGPDPIDTAFVFAKQLWLFHYCGLRTYIDGESPDEVLRDLQAGS